MLTLPEVSERLCTIEESVLIELLDITSEDIVERFQDIVEEKYDILLMEMEGDTTDNG